MPGVAAPQRGRLHVQGDTLTFLSSDDNRVFAVAFERVVGLVAADTSRQTAGGVLLHGFFHRKREKLLSLRVAMADTATTIAFRTERERGSEIAAAIWPHLRAGSARAQPIIRAMPDTPSAASPPDAMVIDSGSYIRVNTTAPRQYIGTLLGGDADSIRLLVPGAPEAVALPRAGIAQIEVDRPRGHALQGALTGATAGALIVLLASASSSEPCIAVCLDFGASTADILIGAAGGGIIGGAMGAAITSDHWQVVYPPRVGLRLVPQHRGGLGVGLSMRF